MRLAAIFVPFNEPCFSIAAFAYSLQVGVKRHAIRPPNMGDIQI